MIPVALAIAGRWKTFAAAAATVLALAAASLALFGLGAWQGFLADSGLARASLEQGLVGDAKMQSAFAAVRRPSGLGLRRAGGLRRDCGGRPCLAAAPRAWERRFRPGDDRRRADRQ